jgi:hypothetical protein
VCIADRLGKNVEDGVEIACGHAHRGSPATGQL